MRADASYFPMRVKWAEQNQVHALFVKSCALCVYTFIHESPAILKFLQSLQWAENFGYAR